MGHNDDLRNYNGYSFNFEDVAKELYRITTKGGVVVWIVGDKTHNGSETGTSFRQALYFKKIGFKLHDTMIYEKINPTPMRANRYQQCFEYMFVFSKGKPKTFNPIMTEKKYIESRKVKYYNKNKDGKQQFREYKSTNNMKVIHNIWSYTVGLNNSTKDKDAFKHPAIFPEKLAEDLLVVGTDWWLERHEYDGAEWWEFKQLPQRPERKIELKNVTGGIWDDLEELNRR